MGDTTTTTTHIRVYEKDLRRIEERGKVGDSYPEVIEELLNRTTNQEQEQEQETTANAE